MKKCVFMAALAIFAACANENEEQPSLEPAQVTLTFSPYEMSAMTRAAVSIADVVTKLDVWVYESGEEVTAAHQTAADDGFGSVSLTLNKMKTYTLYAVAHRVSSGPATLTDGVIAFPDDKVTHAMYYTTTFSPGTTTSLSCEMTRIVAQFVFTTTDQCPDDATKMRFTIGNCYDRWNVTSGASHQVDKVTTFSNFNKKNDGTVAFNVYAIVTNAQTTHSVTVEALDAGDNVLQTRTFTDVPLRNGYKTKYTGVYFTDTPTAASFTIADWSEYETVNF